MTEADDAETSGELTDRIVEVLEGEPSSTEVATVIAEAEAELARAPSPCTPEGTGARD
jgi:hypothetical protein